MLQLADCSLEGLKVLQACNSLGEGVPLYYTVPNSLYDLLLSELAKNMALSVNELDLINFR